MLKRKIIHLIVMMGLMSVLLESSSAVASSPKGEKGPGGINPESSPTVLIENTYIKALSSNGGRFIVGTTGGDPNTPNDDNKRLLYGYSTDVGSSFSTLRINNGGNISDYRLGSVDWSSSGIAPIAPPTSDGTTITTLWEKDGVRVEERLYFIQNSATGRADTTAIEYTLRNNNSSARSVGLRIMLDVMIGGNDGAPYFILGTGQVTQQAEWNGDNVPDYWTAYESTSYDPTSLKGRGQLAGDNAIRPERFVIADWPQASGTVWNYTVNPSDPVTNDSAIILYYDPVVLGSGQTRTVRTNYGIAPSGDTAQLKLTGLEITQAIQNLENSVVLIQDRPTYVRAHVQSTSGTVNDVTAELIGKRNGNLLPGSPLRPANIVGHVDILENPNRSQINDSFFFELPASWRSGTIELEFRGVNKTIACQEHTNTDNDCKATATFQETPALDVRIVGAIWNESDGTSHAPTSADIRELVQTIEAMYPIPYLQWDHPYNFELIIDDWVLDPITLNIRLAEQRVLDGCVNVLGLGCQRIYLGVIVDPPANVSIYGLGGLPPNVASGFWIGTHLRGILPHEIGHALGRLHTPFCDAVTLPWWHYPYSDGHISQDDSGDNAFYGFHISGKAVFGPITSDLMSYCFPVWPSDWTYIALHDEISGRFGSSSMTTEKMNAASTSALLISGRITPTLNTGNIDTIFEFSTSSTFPVATSGSYTLRLEDAGSNVLAIYPFEPESGAQCPPNCSENEQVSAFALAIPYNPQVSRISLLRGQEVLDSKVATANPPQVHINYPNGGEVLSGSSVILSWDASDPDGDTLKYAVQYSTDNGTTWQTLVSSWDSTTYRLDLNAIAGTDQGMLRVMASDGFHTTQDQSDGIFSVAKHSPQTAIHTPGDNSLYVGNQIIIFDGDAFDNEDGQLGDDALTWSSSLNGLLGNGHYLDIDASTLVEGSHTITLTAQDSDSQTNSATITIQIYRTPPLLPTSLLIQPTGMNFLASEGSGQTEWQTLSIRNGGDGTMSWSVNSDQGWIRVSSLNGYAPTDILIAVDPTGLPVGKYTGNLTITASGANNSPQTLPVTLYVIQVQKVYLPIIMR